MCLTSIWAVNSREIVTLTTTKMYVMVNLSTIVIIKKSSILNRIMLLIASYEKSNPKSAI